ncbi:MAG TPA: galactokinase [Candidatus Sulfotelmatobacter sp.]|jgi:galactokinase|nr:galactokinase [Candidatus Sulfotelmatobacter sp.]
MTSPAIAQKFEQRFRHSPRTFRAPGRVNLIGEHTDYNEGFVMPAAVGFSTYVAIAPRTDRKLAIHSEQFPGDLEFDLDHLPQERTGSWCDYVLGVAVVLQRQGLKLPGANLLVYGEVPIGAGLSSSAAIEVASAFALLDLGNMKLPLLEIAKMCRRAENDFVGARVGIMDQFVSCMGKAGHVLFLDCRSLDYKLVPIPPGIELVVCNTKVKHDLATGEYNRRREECEEGIRRFSKWNSAIHALRDVSLEMLEEHAEDLPATIAKRCTHVIRENARTIEAAQALAAGNLARIGMLMRESHQSLRDLYEVSCRELDIMVDSAEGLPGFIGGRMTGGGFGGCTINLVREQDAGSFAEQIAERYHKATGIEPQIYPCTAEDGAQQITLGRSAR